MAGETTDFKKLDGETTDKSVMAKAPDNRY